MPTGTSLYRFYAEDGTLLYVGITSRGPERWRDHEEFRTWWSRVASSRVEHFPDRPAAATAELDAIRTEQPVYNVYGRPRPKAQPIARDKPHRSHGQGSMVPHGRRWMVAVTVGGRRKAYSFTSEEDALLVLTAFQLRGASERARELAAEILDAGTEWEPARS